MVWSTVTTLVVLLSRQPSHLTNGLRAPEVAANVSNEWLACSRSGSQKLTNGLLAQVVAALTPINGLRAHEVAADLRGFMTPAS